MTYRVSYYWNADGGKYVSSNAIFYVADDVVSHMKSSLHANYNTDGFGVKIERKFEEENEWSPVYEGPLNDIVLLGLTCMLKGIHFDH